MRPLIKNCAVYTRKSSDERLDMEFNTLDAQREACLAYITSQKAEGWVPVLEDYDDGGFSGGTLERPALKRLLDEIKTGKIQTVVVYKIDRLTRSLMDFSKLVEIFDQYGVTFVSITQSFNTTTSMGRLTLNVLLSFAQFEREVSGERIRDKIAATKRKGIWTGGTLPLGYDVKDRQLLINTKEAERVRFIFRRYLELGCINEIYRDLKKQGIKSKERKLQNGEVDTGFDFCRSSVHYLLTNKIYIGKIKHKNLYFDGQHEPIISQDLWDLVQKTLISQAVTSRGEKKVREKNILRGLMFDTNGNSYMPTYTNKPGIQYRYYQIKNLGECVNKPVDILTRLPAHEIETKVEKAIRSQISDLHTASIFLQINQETDQALLKIISERQILISARDLILEVVNKVIVDTDHITVEVKIVALTKVISEKLGIAIPKYNGIETKEIKISYTTRRAHKGAIVIESGKQTSNQKDSLDLPASELKNLVRGIIWRDEHFKGKTIRQIASREKFSEGFIGKCIFKTFELT